MDPLNAYPERMRFRSLTTSPSTTGATSTSPTRRGGAVWRIDRNGAVVRWADDPLLHGTGELVGVPVRRERDRLQSRPVDRLEHRAGPAGGDSHRACRRTPASRSVGPLARSGASLSLHRAGVAELVDATGLGPVGRKPLEVRVLSPALLLCGSLSARIRSRGSATASAPKAAADRVAFAAYWPQQRISGPAGRAGSARRAVARARRSGRRDAPARTSGRSRGRVLFRSGHASSCCA